MVAGDRNKTDMQKFNQLAHEFKSKYGERFRKTRTIRWNDYIVY